MTRHPRMGAVQPPRLLWQSHQGIRNLGNPEAPILYAIVHDNPESFADLDGHYGEDNNPGAATNPNSAAKKCKEGGSCPKKSPPPPTKPKKSNPQRLPEFLRQARAESQAWMAEHRNEILKQAGFALFAIVTDGAGGAAGEAGEAGEEAVEVGKPLPSPSSRPQGR